MPLGPLDALLLATLALQGPMRREALAARFWPGAPAERGRNALRQRLFRLQRLTSVALLEADDPVALAGHVQPDVHALQVAGTRPPPGELLQGVTAPSPDLRRWLAAARVQWQDACVRRWRTLATAALAAGDGRELTELARLLLQADPSDEAAHRLLMQGQHLLGDWRQARQAWIDCRRLLRRHAAAAPGPATQELAQVLGLHRATPPASRPARRAELPVTLRRPTRMLGREGDQQAVEQAMAEGLVVVVLGAPGIGKTRLLEELAQAGTPAVLVAVAMGDDAVPYQALQRVLAALQARWGAVPSQQGLLAALPDHQAAGRDVADTGRLRLAWQQALVDWRAAGLTLLAVDDLQFADAATQELLLWPLQVDAGNRPALLLAARDAAADALQKHVASLPDAVQPLWWRLGLLTTDAVVALVASLGLPEPPGRDAVATLAQRSGGHPLWLLQMLSAACESGAALDTAIAQVALPAHLLQVVTRRLHRLSPAALRLLRVLAISGADHDLPLAARVLGCHVVDLADAQRELEQALLVRGRSASYDTVVEAVLNELPQVVAAHLHRLVAQQMELESGRHAAIARHWRLAGEPARCAPHAQLAAQAAWQSGRPVEALALADDAMAAFGQANQGPQRWALAMQALPWAMLAQPVPQVRERLAAQSAWADSDQKRCDLALMAARYALTIEEPQDALTQAEQAEGLAAALGSPQQQAAAAAWKGWALALLGRSDDAMACFAPWLAWADRSDSDARTRLDFHSALGASCFCAGRPSLALPRLQRAAELAEGLQDHAEAMDQWTNVMVCRTGLGDRPGALAAGEAALQAAGRAGRLSGVSAMALNVQLATLHLGMGRYGRVLDLLTEALAWPAQESTASWRVIAEHRMALVWLRLGQPARAMATLRPLHDQATAGNRMARAMMLCRLPSMPRTQVVPTLQATLLEFEGQAQPTDQLALRLMLAAELPPAQALHHTQAVLDDPRCAGLPGLRTHALARHAATLARLGRPADAMASARQAAAAFATAPPHDLETVAWCLLLVQASQGQDDALAGWALDTGSTWLAAARPHVPPAFVDSWVHRNEANAALARRAVPAGLLPRNWFVTAPST